MPGDETIPACPRNTPETCPSYVWSRRGGGTTMSEKPEQLSLDDLDKVTGSDMGTILSMRFQMAMDRESKFLESLSNIMRHMSSTESQITRNLK
jgi:hypothetical protein